LAQAMSPTAGPLLGVDANSDRVQFHVLHASNERDFDTVFTNLAQLRANALVIAVDCIVY